MKNSIILKSNHLTAKMREILVIRKLKKGLLQLERDNIMVV